MTPGARVQAAIEVLEAWRAGQPAERALTQWARGARYAGSKDRAAVRDHVYAVLRCKGRAAVLGGGESGRAWMIGALRLAGVDAGPLFDGVGHAPAPLSDAETAAGGVAGIEADTPDWLRPLVLARFGEETPQVLSAFAERAPVYLRVNLKRADREAAAAALSEAQIETAAEPVSTALRVVSGARKVAQSAPYRDGWLELQDLSVQAAMVEVPWPQTGRILDYCAGGGGKSLALGDLTEAEIFAHDAAPGRMRDLAPRAARAGVRIAELAPGAAASCGPFDAVLCDVPCSGSGTWRRDPEAKWRLTPDRLAGLQRSQAEILRAAAPMVAPGGALVYMTCSLFLGENETQIQSFLNDHAEWTIAREAVYSPLTHSDGFYMCRLLRGENA